MRKTTASSTARWGNLAKQILSKDKPYLIFIKYFKRKACFILKLRKVLGQCIEFRKVDLSDHFLPAFLCQMCVTLLSYCLVSVSFWWLVESQIFIRSFGLIKAKFEASLLGMSLFIIA